MLMTLRKNAICFLCEFIGKELTDIYTVKNGKVITIKQEIYALRIVLFSFLGKACNAVYKYVACIQTLLIVVGRGRFEPGHTL